MLEISTATVRLFLHVLAATVWVGGQLTLAGLLPAVRTLGDDAPRVIARRFNVFAWGAYAVLVATGIWNLFEVDIGHASDAYLTTLGVKLAFVLLSGVAAAWHSLASTRVALAIGGALSGLAALAALFFGVLLRT